MSPPRPTHSPNRAGGETEQAQRGNRPPRPTASTGPGFMYPFQELLVITGDAAGAAEAGAAAVASARPAPRTGTAARTAAQFRILITVPPLRVRFIGSLRPWRRAGKGANVPARRAKVHHRRCDNAKIIDEFCRVCDDAGIARAPGRHRAGRGPPGNAGASRPGPAGRRGPGRRSPARARRGRSQPGHRAGRRCGHAPLPPARSCPPPRSATTATPRQSPGCCADSMTGAPEPTASGPCSPAVYPRPRSSPHSPARHGGPPTMERPRAIVN